MNFQLTRTRPILEELRRIVDVSSVKGCGYIINTMSWQRAREKGNAIHTYTHHTPNETLLFPFECPLLLKLDQKYICRIMIADPWLLSLISHCAWVCVCVRVLARDKYIRFCTSAIKQCINNLPIVTIVNNIIHMYVSGQLQSITIITMISIIIHQNNNNLYGSTQLSTKWWGTRLPFPLVPTVGSGLRCGRLKCDGPLQK